MQIVSAAPLSSLSDDYLRERMCVLNARSEVLRETKYASEWEKIRLILDRVQNDVAAVCRNEESSAKFNE